MQVYGVTEARVEVGYQYRDCAAAVRVTQLARLQGFPVDISQVGGWNLDIHHHYNPHQGDGDTGHVARTRGDGDTCAGILQRGDGSSLDLASLGPVLETLMGDGGQRDFQCEKSACKGELTHRISTIVFSNFFIEPYKNSPHPLCSGSAASLSLLNVVSLATGPDGSVYVGDYNLIRRIHPGGSVETILQFR